MKILKLLIILLFVTVPAYATPSISNYNNGVLECTDAGTRSDNNGFSQEYLCYAYDDFESGDKDDIFDEVSSSFNLTQSGVRAGSTQCLGCNTDGSLVGAGLSTSSSNEGYFTNFWFQTPSDQSYESDSQYKLLRIGNERFGYPNITWGKHEFTADRQHIITIEGGGDPALSFNQYYSDHNTVYDDGEWHNLRMWFKPSTGLENTDGEIKFYIDNEELVSTTEARTDGNSKNTYNGRWIVLAYVLNLSKSYRVDDIYYDYSQAQVYLGDASTFSECTHLEIQPTTAWSDTEITIEQNNGSFSDEDTAYLYVMDSDGNVSDGYEVYLGEIDIQPGINGSVIIKGAVTITP